MVIDFEVMATHLNPEMCNISWNIRQKLLSGLGAYSNGPKMEKLSVGIGTPFQMEPNSTAPLYSPKLHYYD